MSIDLGVLQLSDHLVLDGIESAQERADVYSRSLFGVTTRMIGPVLEGGKELQLVSENHIYYDQVVELKALQTSGEVVALVHPRGTYNVVVTAVDLTPDSDLVDPHNDPDLWYSGTVTLMTL